MCEVSTVRDFPGGPRPSPHASAGSLVLPLVRKRDPAGLNQDLVPPCKQTVNIVKNQHCLE